MACVWELTEQNIYLPLGCLQGDPKVDSVGGARGDDAREGVLSTPQSVLDTTQSVLDKPKSMFDTSRRALDTPKNMMDTPQCMLYTPF